VSSLRPGKVALCAYAPGYGFLQISDIEVKSGKTTEGIIFALGKSGVIKGVVLTADGATPAEGMRVYFDRAGAGDNEFPAGASEAQTTSFGEFSIRDVPVGKQRLRILHPKYPTTFADVLVKEGQEMSVTVRITDFGAIEGIVSLDGAPINEAHLVPYSLVNYGGESPSSTRSDAAGRFKLSNLRPGEYEITCSFGKPGGAYYGKKSKIAVEAGQTYKLDIPFVSGGCMVEGKILLNGVAPLAGADAVSLRAVNGDTYAGTRFGENGAFRIEGLAPGDYKLGILYRLNPRASQPLSTENIITLREGETTRVDLDLKLELPQRQ